MKPLRTSRQRKSDLTLSFILIIVIVIFLSAFCKPTISGKLSLSDIFSFFSGSEQGVSELSSCSNKILDIGESDIDCGGPCKKCEIGQACNSREDCKSNSCNPILKVCNTPTCNDNLQNGDELGIDCGGGCKPCHCFNGIIDPGEDKIDCSITSSTCPLCDVSGYPPHCSDGVQNAGEVVGIDCGSSCSFMEKKNPQTCYLHEQACKSANFWWCGNKAKCLPGPVSDCISEKESCERYGFFWCDSYSTCYDEKAYWCITDKESCEELSFFWCSKFNYCINYNYCNCYPSQATCEQDSLCDWGFQNNQFQCITSSWANK